MANRQAYADIITHNNTQQSRLNTWHSSQRQKTEVTAES